MSDSLAQTAPIAARSPVAGLALPETPNVTIEEVPIASLVQVAAWPETVEHLSTALSREGLPVLPSPARATRGGEAVALDVAPGRALIVSERPDLAATLEAALPSDIATTVDLGHARVRLRLSGDRAAWVLSKGVAIDLHADAFPVDAAAATQFDHIGVILHRSGDDVFDLYVYRGFAEALWHELGEAARADGVLAPAAMGG